MDDESVYGKEVFEHPLAQAVADGRVGQRGGDRPHRRRGLFVSATGTGMTLISIRVADELGAAELVQQVDEGLLGPRTQVVNLERSGPPLPVIDRGSGRLMTLVDVSRSGRP
ncbi:hypothetical protein [Streptomyces werraensis]|uniref:hypothetical protein n=1 Tax=Streptomyces werraensis TaxID=68284 RepID=UPI003678644F